MLRRAIEHVVKDESLNIPVEPATSALNVSRIVLEWASQEDHQPAYLSFQEKVVSALRTCIPSLEGCKEMRLLVHSNCSYVSVTIRSAYLNSSTLFGAAFSGI